MASNNAEGQITEQTKLVAVDKMLDTANNAIDNKDTDNSQLSKDASDNQEMLSENRGKIKEKLRKFERQEKQDKTKAIGSRELGDLDDKAIIPERLRSSSGRVYSSAVRMVANTALTALSQDDLPTVSELPEKERQNSEALHRDQSTLRQSSQENEDEEMINITKCSSNACCKNTSTLVDLMRKLQDSVDNLTTEVKGQNLFKAKTEGTLKRIEEEQDSQAMEIQKVLTELKETKSQLHTMAKIVIHQDQKITTLSNKLISAQAREMTTNLVI